MAQSGGASAKADPLTLCGGHRVCFVAASGQIRMAADTTTATEQSRPPAVLPIAVFKTAARTSLSCDDVPRSRKFRTHLT